MTENPNKDWYSRISREQGVGIHCPFATVESCPRYFESLSLLEDTGATSMAREEVERLKKKWRSSDLWPRIGEQGTSVFKSGDRLSFISNFCPEVAFERFGIFCSGLSTYTDEFDREGAYQWLKRQGASENDPRWTWQRVEPLHFTACKHYSVLKHRAGSDKKQEPWWREHLAKIIVGAAIAVASAVAGHYFK